MKQLIALLFSLSLIGCSSISTEADYDPATDFSGYKTWSWIQDTEKEGKNKYHMDGLQDRRIRTAVQDQLSLLGYRQVDAEKADFQVNYLTQVEKKIDIDTFYSDFGYHPYYYGRYHRPGRYGYGYGAVHADTRVREYKEGTIIVDLIDSESRQLLWRGAATDRLRKNQTPEERTSQVNEVVNAILTQFPPGRVTE